MGLMNVITVKRGSRNDYCPFKYWAIVLFRYGGNDKSILSCGARVVIETEADVEIVE